METVAEVKPTTDRIGQLKAILYLLQTNLEGFKDEVDRSYELLKIGEKTPLSKTIENSLENPFESVFQMSGEIDKQVKSIIDKIVKSFFVKNKEYIKHVYRSKTSLNDLHYSIVLANDNLENRDKIFDFFDKFDLIDISNKYPVYFQFVPIELVEKIAYSEEIQIA